MIWTGRNDEQIDLNTCRRNDITHYAGSSRGLNVALKREGGIKEEKKELLQRKQVVSPQVRFVGAKQL